MAFHGVICCLHIITNLAFFLLDCGEERPSDVRMLKTLQCLGKMSKQNLAALLCIDSSFWMFSAVWGSQTEDAYSTIGQSIFL